MALKAFEIREQAERFLANNEKITSPQESGNAGYKNLVSYKMVDKITEA